MKDKYVRSYYRWRFHLVCRAIFHCMSVCMMVLPLSCNSTTTFSSITSQNWSARGIGSWGGAKSSPDGVASGFSSSVFRNLIARRVFPAAGALSDRKPLSLFHSGGNYTIFPLRPLPRLPFLSLTASRESAPRYIVFWAHLHLHHITNRPDNISTQNLYWNQTKILREFHSNLEEFYFKFNRVSAWFW